MSKRPQWRRIARSLVCAGTAAVVAVGLVSTGSPAQAAPAKATVKADKIQPDLTKQLQAKPEADFWIHFGARADLSKAGAIKDWNKRGTAVADALKKTANASQSGVVAQLNGSGTKYKTFWATNAIKVYGGSAATVQALAARTEVDGLYPTRKVEVPKVTKGDDEKSVNALEWGVANINADDVWSQYGVRGEGITVASIDTGVDLSHPALVGKYRGNNGDGTFDHNYNWFDAAGTCNGAPCDNDEHGTHTMGTMLGGDGANEIGVAPNAKWISANGCCPSDEALISSGQWMLEPTDLQGQNPDASKRPNIINNSWGTTAPSNDPFMEDETLAWTASGIFGMFSNGNSGPACATSGSPGSLQSNYSTGAYDINNNIASFSSRGAGQNGEIKPNISAPGVNVRSSIPGGGYASFSGTSMASPHTVGAIALLWSAAPALVGDVEGTRALLNETAIDKSDLSCGGTAADNNVYGEGRLDALALLNAAPIGDSGILAGKVTDEATGAPIAHATVTITGSVTRTVSTAADGTYSTRLPVGDYSVSVTAFGYVGETATATVTADQTTTLNFALAGAPSVTVSGAVTDGSGHGWPLYTKVTVQGASGVSDYTNPVNGRYSLTLPAGATYTLTYDTVYPGYETVTKETVVAGRNLVQNVSVPVDPDSCSEAPGYVNGSDGLYETFDGTTKPAGWTVVDNAGEGQSWAFDDPGHRGNLTGGTGDFAILDSDHYGAGHTQDGSLISPKVDLSAVTAPVIRFNQDFNALGDDFADVDLSVDGGATWSTVLSQPEDARGPRVTEIPIPQAAGKTAVQVRFHFYQAAFAWWWEVDNVLLGSKVECVPTNGALVVGNVKDKNTDGYINGATVTSLDNPADKAVTTATPDDTDLPDGFYWLFSSKTGNHPFKATAPNYGSQTKTVNVEADWTTQANFELGSGRLVVEPTALTGTVQIPNGKVTKSFTVTNSGDATVDVEFGERDNGFELLKADGTRVTEQQILGSKGAATQRLKVPTSFAAKGAKGATTSKGTNADPWTDIAAYPQVIMDNRVVTVDGKVYSIGGGDGNAATTKNFVYDPVAQSWAPIADLPGARNAPTVGVVDGTIIVTGGWGDDGAPAADTWAYDPGANTWEAKADNPAPRSAAGQAVADGKLYAIGGCTTSGCLPMANDVVAYDLGSDTWETLPDYPVALAFPACGAIDGAIYCSGGNDGNAATAAGFSFDPGAGSWTPIPNSPSDHWAASAAIANDKLMVVGGVQADAVTNAGFAYDPSTEQWAALPNANQARYRGGAACGFYKVGGSSGGFAADPASEVLPGFEECAAGGADVSWLSIDKTSATLEPGDKVTVKVTMSGNVDQPGTYKGGVTIKENTPYTVPPVDVTMIANPPKSWGKLTGKVTGASCAGVTAPINGATVQVNTWASSLSLSTNTQGEYAYWIDRRNNPLTLIVAKDGWQPQTRKAKITAGGTTVEDFQLTPTRC
jgi:subtilisin family serine protease